MNDILTHDDLVTLTEMQRPAAQARVLRALGIKFQVRPSGTVLVLRDDVMGQRIINKAEREPKINWDALDKLNAKEAYN